MTEFLIKERESILIPLIVILTLSITRPGCQILVAIFEKNLKRSNLIKWIKTGLLNASRALTLCFINYICRKYMKENKYYRIIFNTSTFATTEWEDI